MLRYPLRLAVAADTATVTVQNDDFQRGKAQLAASTATVAENAGQFTLTVERIEGSDSTLEVAYATSDGSAVAGSPARHSARPRPRISGSPAMTTGATTGIGGWAAFDFLRNTITTPNARL